jgi:hypothetical protein
VRELLLTGRTCCPNHAFQTGEGWIDRAQALLDECKSKKKSLYETVMLAHQTLNLTDTEWTVFMLYLGNFSLHQRQASLMHDLVDGLRAPISVDGKTH